MTALILYFSGTGNTKYVANLFSQALVAKGVSVQMRSAEEPQPIEPGYDFLVVGCPKYYEYPALFLLQYLRKVLPTAQRQTPVFAFCTEASAAKTDFSGLAKLLRQKNHDLPQGTISRPMLWSQGRSCRRRLFPSPSDGIHQPALYRRHPRNRYGT